MRLVDDRGQAMVEFIIVLPVMLFLIFMIAYAGIGFERYARVTNAARVAARAAAVARFQGIDPCDAAQTAADNALNGLTLDGPPTCVPSSSQPGEMITVTLHYTLPDIPIVSGIFGTTTVTGEATERME